RLRHRAGRNKSPLAALPVSYDRQRHEGAAVALTDDAHEDREIPAREEIAARHEVHRGKRDGVNANETLAVRVGVVAPIDLAYDGIDRALLEVVAVDIQRDLLVGIVEPVDGGEDALARIRVRERSPIFQRVENRLPASRRIGNPFVPIALEHVLAFVVHDLDALDGRIDLERLAQLLLHAAPLVLLHAAGRIYQENDVLAVDGNAADLVILDRRPIVGQQPLHLLRQRLLGRRETVLLGLQRRIFDAQHLRADALELGLQILDAVSVDLHFVGRRNLLVAHALGLADDLVQLLLVLGDQTVEIALGLLEPPG